MVINLQKEMLKNQDDVMDKIILKAALDYDDRAGAYKQLSSQKNAPAVKTAVLVKVSNYK